MPARKLSHSKESREARRDRLQHAGGWKLFYQVRAALQKPPYEFKPRLANQLCNIYFGVNTVHEKGFGDVETLTRMIGEREQSGSMHRPDMAPVDPTSEVYMEMDDAIPVVGHEPESGSGADLESALGAYVANDERSGEDGDGFDADSDGGARLSEEYRAIVQEREVEAQDEKPEPQRRTRRKTRQEHEPPVLDEIRRGVSPDYLPLLNASVGKTSTRVDEIEWVHANLLLPLHRIDMASVPGPGAVTLLEWAHANGNNRATFVTQVYAKVVTKEKPPEDDERLTEDGRTNDEVLADFERQLLTEADAGLDPFGTSGVAEAMSVLSGGPEESA